MTEQSPVQIIITNYSPYDVRIEIVPSHEGGGAATPPENGEAGVRAVAVAVVPGGAQVSRRVIHLDVAEEVRRAMAKSPFWALMERRAAGSQPPECPE